MSAGALLLVALGGAIGSVARALAGQLLPSGRLPWSTILVNIAGSLLIGWLVARFANESVEHGRAHTFWVVGVCGGFTTFSAFSWQTVDRMVKGDWAAASANVILSVMLCLAATWLGWKWAR